MCELNVYIEGEEVARDVVKLVVSGDKILMEDIIGTPTEVVGRIREINITSQKAILDRV